MTKLDMLEKEIKDLKDQIEKSKEDFKKSFNENPLETLANAGTYGVNAVNYLQTSLNDFGGTRYFTVELIVKFENNDTIFLSMKDPQIEIIG